MKEDGENVVSSLNYWAFVSAINGDEMSTTFGAKGEMSFLKYLSPLI
jgi:hypothetical protein